MKYIVVLFKDNPIKFGKRGGRIWASSVAEEQATRFDSIQQANEAAQERCFQPQTVTIKAVKK